MGLESGESALAGLGLEELEWVERVSEWVREAQALEELEALELVAQEWAQVDLVQELVEWAVLAVMDSQGMPDYHK